MLIRFYRTASGASPVEKYLAALPGRERAAVLADLKDLQEKGLQPSAIVTRQIRGKLWELKISAHRVFYIVVSGPAMVLLHAYRKQGKKAPPREIQVAEQRMRQILEGTG